MFIFYDKFYIVKFEDKLKMVVLDYVIVVVEIINWKGLFLREVKMEKEYGFVFIC